MKKEIQSAVWCSLAVTLAVLFARSGSAAPRSFCQQLLMQYGRMNAPRLPATLHFHSWSPGSELPHNQKSLGKLEFSWSQPGSITVDTISGLQEMDFMRRRVLSRILGLTTFAGFVGEDEFKEVLDQQPIPETMKQILAAPGLVHLVKRLPEKYYMFNADTSPEYLRKSLSSKALHKLRTVLDGFEKLLAREGLTVDSPHFVVTEDGNAFLTNFEAIRERSDGDVDIFLWREKNVAEIALLH